MLADWGYVKNASLWRYEELIQKLRFLSAYPLLWQAYNHDMRAAAAFARCLFAGRDIDGGEFPAPVIVTIERLDSVGIKDWGDLLGKVTTRADCLRFVAGSLLEFREFIDVLVYLLRWAFPFQTSSRELLDHDNPWEMAFHPVLKACGFRNSFDLLQSGHTQAGRRSIAGESGLPLDFVTSLVHRADIARLPFVRRKTILPLCGAGFDTLEKITATEPARMEAALDAYFRRTQNKPWANFKSVILPEGLITAARALPPIVDRPLASPERSVPT